MSSRVRTLWFAIICSAALCGGLLAADWPTYRHDMARSGVSPAKLRMPLHVQWTHRAAHAPRPAWPEPGRELNRLAFDYAYEVTSAGGLVYFGSSADHKVYAIELATGRERWSYFTGGPVRFAPTLSEGRLFVGSDDGWLYCLSAARGDLLWRFHAGPKQEKVMGNEQMISRWPLRAGVGVENGIVYFTAGMWPNEGVYVYALRAEDGKVVWQNDTSGAKYLRQPHPGSYSMTGVSPQGYLLANEAQVFVPTGRNTPAVYDRATGALLYYRSAPTSWSNRWGGCWNFLANGMLFGWVCHVGPDIDAKLGEYSPDPKDGIVVYEAATGKEKREFAGKLCAVVSGDRLYASGSGKVSAYDANSWLQGAKEADCLKWETDQSRTYAMALAGDTLLVGGQDGVRAIAALEGKPLWDAKTKGQARSLAVADGRLIVSTTAGEITCYGPQVVKNPASISRGPQAPAKEHEDRASTQAQAARQIVAESGKRAGCCLVIGADGGQLLYHLARESDLSIYCVEAGEQKVTSLRQAFDAAGLYGTRVAVHRGSLLRVTYPDYFADLVVLGGSRSGLPKGLRAEDVYRVLHPCGGVAYFPTHGSAASASAIKQWLAAGHVPANEVTASASAVRVVRGKLPGAGNWTHQYANAARTGSSTDERVRTPMKLLWFGRPGPARLISRHRRGPAPLCVDGRLFVIGQFSVVAADAYNGRELWCRDLPLAGRWPVHSKGSNVAADGESLYLVTGNVCTRLAAATGESIQTIALPAPPANVPTDETQSLVWSYLAVTDKHILGSMGKSNLQGTCVFVLNKSDGKARWVYAGNGVVPNNALTVDDRRVYLIEQAGAADVARAKRRGQDITTGAALVALDANDGRLVYRTTETISGRNGLWLSQHVLLATGNRGMSGYEPDSGKLLYSRDANVSGFPVIVGDTIYAQPLAYDLRTGAQKTRTHPLTGEKTPWIMNRGYGCGAVSGAPNLLMFRSATLGFYDLAGDTGVHNFGGIRAGCFINAIAASGLMLVPPADAACTCSYSLRTTVALMPAQTGQSWSIIYDSLPTTTVKRAGLNLGAPADRMDGDGAAWLAMPRPGTRAQRADFAEPFRFAFMDGFGPYRRKSDTAGIEQSRRPWIYASGLKGMRRAEFDLDILNSGFVAWPVVQPPALDGKLDEPCWDGYRAIPLRDQNASVTLRHDDKNLYVAYKRLAAIDESGQSKPWMKATKGSDPAVWADDSFGMYLSRAPRDSKATAKKCMHLALSASGARYDALWTYVSPFPVLDVPKLDVAIDGNSDDWGERGLKVVSLPGERGRMCAAKDFNVALRIGWTDKGVAILAHVSDDVIHESANSLQLWMGDSVEFFMTPKVGSNESYQVIVAPGASSKQTRVRKQSFDRRRATRGTKLGMVAASAKVQEGYVIEVLLPWADLKIKPVAGREFGLQMFANDSDADGRKQFLTIWHPGGHPTNKRNPFAYQGFRLADKPSKPVEFKRSAKPSSDGFFRAVRPYPFPLKIPAMGAKGEDVAYAGDWASGVHVTPQAFTAEIAIPWAALAAQGMDRGSLMIDLNARGKLPQAPKLGRGFQRAVLVSPATAKRREVKLRLHFAELDDVKPGERVFDVKVQGKVLLKDFDVVKAAGGPRRPVVREFAGIVATRSVTLELDPKASEVTPLTAPIISGIEIVSVDSPKETQPKP